MKLSAKIIRETSKAYLAVVDMISPDSVGVGAVQFTTEVWLPKSQTEVLENGLEVPEWLAKSEGFLSPKRWGRHEVISYAVEAK